MGFLVYNMINPIYGKRAANSVVLLLICMQGMILFGFVSRFKKIADAAKPKFIWSAMQDVNSQIKANVVAVLGAQFKPPEHVHMPQSASLSILQSLDGFCIAKTPKKAVNDFLSYWEKAADPKYRMSDADICDFANTIRILRQQVASFIMSNPDAKAIQQCQMLQSQLCYIEAGFYRVSQLKLVGDRYVRGPRTNPQRINPLQQGYFAFEQPSATSESGLENKARELKHDVLVSGLFALEEQAFSELDCHPAEGVSRMVFSLRRLLYRADACLTYLITRLTIVINLMKL